MRANRWVIYGCVSIAFIVTYTGCGIGLALKTIASGLPQPVLISGMPDNAGQMVIAERAGVLKTLDVATGDTSVSMDIGDRVDTWGNRGLMGFAFDPNFGTNGFFYVLYNHAPGPVSAESTKIRVSRFVSEPGDAFMGDLDSEEILIEFEGYTGEHNGGSLVFSPVDGYLYIFTGDAKCCHDPFSLAQDLTVFNGKILRIDVSAQKTGEVYAIPDDNPFAGSADARPEIWAYGVRNPFRASFDSETGDLYFADVGEKAYEEINYQPVSSIGGENYGWPLFEGGACNPNAASEIECTALMSQISFPVLSLEYGFSRSVTGGVVYRGNAMPEQRGTYFFGDWVNDTLWSIRVEGGIASPMTDWTDQVDPEGELLQQLVGFGEDADHELYALTYSGNVYRLQAATQ